mgnify:CR=1 FL=1
MERGKFIVLEGIDGSGKSSQTGPLVRRLEELGVPCRETREPTGGPVGSLIRQIFTGRATADNRVIAALYAADRLDHLVNEVDGLCAAIDRGITVVSDRYYFSSYAYHSVDMDMDWVIGANSVSADLLRPTVTVFLDVPVETALERIRQNRYVEEIFDREDRLRRTRELYFEAFARLRDVENVAVVDGSGSREQVARRVWAAVAPYFA